MVYLLPIYLCFLVTPIIFSHWLAHALVAIFTVFYVRKVTNYYFFWILLLIVVIFSAQTRLSLEYFLIASSLIGFTLSDHWLKQSFTTRRNVLLISFVVFFFLDYSNLNFVEKGSALMFLPVYLAIFFPLKKFNWSFDKKLLIYIPAFLAILCSNKRTTLIAFLTSLKNLFSQTTLIVFSLLIIISSFFIKDNLSNFYRKSIAPRTLIWQGAFKGFLDKPIFGHGFGTFAINFPPYRFKDLNVIGAKNTEYIVHGHNQFVHSLFESGLFGFILLMGLFVLVYRYANNAFLPLLIISFFNVSLQSFSQIMLLALILNPLLESNSLIFKKIINQKIFLNAFTILITSTLMLSSVFGHFFFDQGQYSRAIKVDPWHPLYYFSRGARKINTDIEQSKKDLGQALKLASNIGYFHAFYAAALLGTGDFINAKYHINKSLSQMGEDPYLLILSYFINQDDKELAQEHYQKAIKLNPDLEMLLYDPSYTADEFIGVRASNPRIMSFYRSGTKIYLPLPYIEQ